MSPRYIPIELLSFDIINNLDESIQPWDFTTDNVGNVYVLSSSISSSLELIDGNYFEHGFIFKFNQAGIFLEAIDLGLHQSNTMTKLVSDSLGNMYYNYRTTDMEFKINKILPNGNIVTVVEDQQNLGCLTNIEIDSTGNIYVTTNPNCVDTSSAKYKYLVNVKLSVILLDI